MPAALPAAFPSAIAPLSLPATYHSPVLTPVARPVYTTLPSAGLPALPAALPVVPGCRFSYSCNHFFQSYQLVYGFTLGQNFVMKVNEYH